MEPFPPFPSRLVDQNFGMCITPQDMILPTNNICTPNYFRPWRWYIPNTPKDCGSTIENEKDKFQVTLDVQHFKPSEISVKVLNKQIIIEGEHEERLDAHGMISRQFTRRYELPSYCDAEDVTSNLSSDGVLTVIAHKKCNHDLNTERSVPINLCNTFSKIKEVESSSEADKWIKTSDASAGKEQNCDILKKDTEETCTKNKSQLMLKEDHCCLLKPELFMQSKSSAEDKFLETKSEMEELLKMRTEKFDEAISAIATSTEEIMKLTMDNSNKCRVATKMDESMKSVSVKDETIKGSVSCSLDDSTVESAKEGPMQCSIASTVDESVKSTIASSRDESIKSTVASSIDESIKSTVTSSMDESINSAFASKMDESFKTSVGSANEESSKTFTKSTFDETMKCSIVEDSIKSSVASAIDESIKLASELAGMSSMSAASEVTSYSSETMQTEESSSFMSTASSNLKANEKFRELFSDTVTAALKEAAENL